MLHQFFFLFLSLIVVAGCGGGESGQTAQQGRPGGGPPGGGMFRSAPTTPAVEVVQAQYGGLPLEERLVGIVKADNQVEIYPEITAPVSQVLVQNGEKVERGQALVRLEARQFQEQLNQAKASLDIAKADAQQSEARLRQIELQFERTKQLADKELISDLELETEEAQVQTARAQLDRSKAQVNQAQATVEEREENLRRTVIRAPISGTVGQRDAEVGMRANTNTRLFIIGNFGKVRVEVDLTERMLGYIQQGQRARITGENLPDTVLVGMVSRISPFLEAGSFSTTAELDLTNEGNLLKPGMFLTVDVFYGESEQATIVPNSALYENPTTGATGVFVAASLGLEIPPALPENDEDVAPLSEPTPITFKEINVLAAGRDMAGVDGIEEGEWVITIGQNMLLGRDVEARVRVTTWNRLIALQNLQREDLLKQFLEKQQKMANTGALATLIFH